MKLKQQKGFTLIELLVVISILGVLTAFAVPNVLKFIGTGNTAASNQELQNVMLAVTAAKSATPPIDPTTENSQIIAGVGIGQFLEKDTEFKYTIDAAGQITQGARVT